MKKYRKLSVLIVTLILFTQLCCGQDFWRSQTDPPPPSIPYHKTLEIFKHGISVTIVIDSFSQKWGVKMAQLEEAAQTGVRAAGWEFNPSSEIDITVSIDSMMPRNDSIFALKIETGRTRKTIDMKKNEMGLLSSIIQQLVYNVANRKRKDIILENSRRIDPQHQRQNNANAQ